MERILEPEYMDTPEEASEYDAMDHAAANAAASARFLELGGGRGRIVDLGTGPGDLPILLCGQTPELTAVGVDAAETMLAIARDKVAAAGLADRIELRRADVKALPFPDGSFDGVFSNTILHHIPDPVAFLAEADRVRRDGGTLMIRDLYRPDSEDEAWRLVDLHAAGATPRQRQLLFDSLHAALTLEEARAAVAGAGIVDATVTMSSDRHYTIEIPAR